MSILSVLGIGASTAQERAKTEAGQMCVLRVSGMHCGQCEKTVEKAARTLDGVISAKASQPDRSAEIIYDPARTNPDAVAKAISEKTPFTAEAVRR